VEFVFSRGCLQWSLSSVEVVSVKVVFCGGCLLWRLSSVEVIFSGVCLP
jgi:hypothetical protein